MATGAGSGTRVRACDEQTPLVWEIVTGREWDETPLMACSSCNACGTRRPGAECSGPHDGFRRAKNRQTKTARPSTPAGSTAPSLRSAKSARSTARGSMSEPSTGAWTKPLEISRAIVADHACTGAARFPHSHSGHRR